MTATHVVPTSGPPPTVIRAFQVLTIPQLRKSG